MTQFTNKAQDRIKARKTPSNDVGKPVGESNAAVPDLIEALKECVTYDGATYQGLTPFEASYFETALWSSTDGDGEPLDSAKYSDAEPTEATISRIKADCDSFIRRAEDLFDVAGYNMSAYHVAHDFWLTRNRHGAGFWDGDYPEPLGKQLTDLAHGFGEINLYVDDNKIYME